MGLDQYIYLENKKIKEDEEDLELHYWRKNYKLNEWACEKWCPEAMADFNCKRLYLSEEHVSEFIDHIIFNLEQYQESQIGWSEDILEAMMDCQSRIKEGDTVYYYAWW